MKLRVENFGTLHPVIVNNLELYIIDLFSIAVSSTHHTTFITLVQLYDNTFQFVYGQIPEYIKQKHIKCVEGGDIDRTFSEQQFIPTKIRESLLELFLSFINSLDKVAYNTIYHIDYQDEGIQVFFIRHSLDELPQFGFSKNKEVEHAEQA